MDESLQELENELKRLTPRRPSPVLRERIERELQRPAPVVPPASSVSRFPLWPWRGLPLLAAAAAVALVAGFLLIGRPRPAAPSGELAQNSTASRSEAAPEVAVVAPPPVAAPNIYRPVRATNVLYDLQDDGTVWLSDNTPAHRMRYRYMDTYTWKNPATNASLKWTVPRDEVRVIPASLP